MTEPPLLEVRDLARHYVVSRGLLRRKGLVRALAGVSFSLAAGRTLAVVGESGCGKSTLARQVTMIEPPTSGTLLVEGHDVAHADAQVRRRRAQSGVAGDVERRYTPVERIERGRVGILNAGGAGDVLRVRERVGAGAVRAGEVDVDGLRRPPLDDVEAHRH